MREGPVTAVIVGAGHRSLAYASYALRFPERLRIVAVADPVRVRREVAAKLHGIPAAMQFESYEDLLGRAKLADAVINGTMDQMHYRSTMPLIEMGYDILLEKPIAPTEEEVRNLIAAARHHDRVVMICHLLRCQPLYRKIKQMVMDGAIGEILAIHTCEDVSYHHMATSYVRGRWSRRETSTPMLLAKCCHDLDIMAWMMSGIPAKRVSSFGKLSYFRAENAPPGSAKRCLDGCKIESTCPYSAKTIYMDMNLWGAYAWEPIEQVENPTVEQKLESLRTTNPYGRCVWYCDNDVVDHQSVIVQFADGVTGTHDMRGNATRARRKIHLVGTLGEIEGDMEGGIVQFRKPNTHLDGPYTALSGYDERRIEIPFGKDGEGHGGTDSMMIENFVDSVSGRRGDPWTKIEDSLTGHLIAFAADRAMTENRVVEIT